MDHSGEFLCLMGETGAKLEQRFAPNSTTQPTTGVIKANTLILGYKHSWNEQTEEQVEEYVGIIKDAFDHHFAVGMFVL